MKERENPIVDAVGDNGVHGVPVVGGREPSLDLVGEGFGNGERLDFLGGFLRGVAGVDWTAVAKRLEVELFVAIKVWEVPWGLDEEVGGGGSGAETEGGKVRRIGEGVDEVRGTGGELAVDGERGGENVVGEGSRMVAGESGDVEVTLPVDVIDHAGFLVELGSVPERERNLQIHDGGAIGDAGIDENSLVGVVLADGATSETGGNEEPRVVGLGTDEIIMKIVFERGGSGHNKTSFDGSGLVKFVCDGAIIPQDREGG